MNAKWIGVGLVALALVALGLMTTAAQSSADAAYACTGDFQAGITQGPDANFSVDGTLDLTVADRVATGTVTLKSGGTVNVTGQVDGQALNLAFEIAGGKYIFGVGTSTDDFANCTGVAGGPLAGPQPGDLGDWGYAIGGKTPPQPPKGTTK